MQTGKIMFESHVFPNDVRGYFEKVNLARRACKDFLYGRVMSMICEVRRYYGSKHWTLEARV